MNISANAWSKISGVAVVLFLFAYGLFSFPLALFGPDRAMIPGDLGDSRFNNYILEHFHQWTAGKVDSYWDAPFMYPHQNVTALSDNLLGTAPVYSLFRRMGYGRESAFQLWILLVFAMNYICCFLALRQWSRHAVLAACGAYIFAFGIHSIGHLDHAQMFPRMAVPLALWWCWQWLQHGRILHFLLTALAVVFQFYCAIYLGFILCYVLLCLMIAHVLMHLGEIRRYLPAGWRRGLAGLGIIALAAAIMLPLMLPYLEASKVTDMRRIDEVRHAIPRLQGLFFTHPAALSWRSLSLHSQNAFDEWWNQFHFMGGLPWLAVLLAPWLLWRRDLRSEQRRTIGVLMVALLLAIIFCLRIGDFTLYGVVHALPGFSAMRSIDRFMPVIAMLFIALMTLVFSNVPAKAWPKLVIGIVLALVVVLDNRIDVGQLKRYNKNAAREFVDRARLDMQLQAGHDTRAIAYTPARGALDHKEDHHRSIAMHLTAMLAAQELGMPVVNAYTGYYPQHYMAFWDRQDRRTLEDWIFFNGMATDGIQLVNGVREPIFRADTVQWRGPNGKFLSADPRRPLEPHVDNGDPGLWETFVRLELAQGRTAFVAHTDRFLSVELHRDSGLVVVSDRLGDMGVFILQEHNDGTVGIRADNGRFLVLDTLTYRIHARGDSTDALGRFRLPRPAP